MGIKKQFLKTRPFCKVTFRLPKQAVQSAATAHLVGEFNNWDTGAHPMQRLKKGGFKVTLELEPNREYQYRYLLDQTIWQTDQEADKYASTPYADSQNSVVVV